MQLYALRFDNFPRPSMEESKLAILPEPVPQQPLALWSSWSHPNPCLALLEPVPANDSKAVVN